MTEPWPDIAASYDLVAEQYAAQFAGELDAKPADRALLDDFAAAVAGGPVLDIGCGPAGQITRYLADRGVAASGVDLSPACVAVARSRQPDLSFEVADMRALPAAGASLAGIVAFYSVIHLPADQLPAALAEFRRVLRPDGQLLIAVHGGGDEDAGGTAEFRTAEFLGQPVPFAAILWSPTRLAAELVSAGFEVRRLQVRGPYPAEHASERIYLWAGPE